ncbi:MAG: glycoside hydrolase family 43 protein [Butyrivibrio sp.]|uniref:glycoside hydrolase family 43 protein n=1 Tax=Butyrivibrio sp. TaxID=28121 RepID=UPI001B1C6B50|nr:glycoside hydrolase family 43 protein [Butyrivibrio sp.]MBO6242763.1 glycoside hydrolase family 43 protein [Butyrivibrio sp.]
MISNPILKGFHPDPSIIRVGDEYYIATSTFEWWPGVRLHHSKDLKNWELIEYPLNRVSQLDLRGVGPSQGIWAPCLTYENGIFYLVYTIVRSFYCNMYDTENFLVTATDIHGPWSEPVPLNNFGFDPSLFHDDDGKKYMVSMVTDHRVPKKYAGRIVLQEYDSKAQRMIGEAKDIFKASDIFLEGPHIFKRNGWYYLFCADTGTGELHGQSILRSRNIRGPYEMKKDKPEKWEKGEAYSIMTSRHNPDILLQKAGHCDMVETQEGEWYMVHLCGRPSDKRNPETVERFKNSRRYMLGRETAIQKVIWENDWPYLYSEKDERVTTVPQEKVFEPTFEKRIDESSKKNEEISVGDNKRIFEKDDFDNLVLNPDYQSLRIPMDERYLSLSERPGYLRLFGRSGLSSQFSQSLIARRMTSYNMEIKTCVEYEPKVFKQMAGLIFMYDTENYLYLHITHDEDIGKCITLLKYENKKAGYLSDYIPIPEKEPVRLKLTINGTEAIFEYSVGDPDKSSCITNRIAPPVDASFLSDEACNQGWFTGAMIGICTQDLTGFGLNADFDYFEVKDLSM